MKMDELKSYDVKDKFVVISAEISDEQMSHISQLLKKAGAIEVVFAYGGIDIKTLSVEDLANIGLCRIEAGKAVKAKTRKRRKG